ncbi:MAG: hypothetical protein KA715_07890 [Xanthomonadaceae bacterium]|nr:hypothetical protein [Xanthomonadaceae bacterium]
MTNIRIVPAYISPFANTSPTQLATNNPNAGDEAMIQEIIEHQQKHQNTAEKIQMQEFSKNLWVQAYTTLIYFMGACQVISIIFLDKEGRNNLMLIIQSFF